jgi:hypothetical protein
VTRMMIWTMTVAARNGVTGKSAEKRTIARATDTVVVVVVIVVVIMKVTAGTRARHDIGIRDP